MKHQFNWMWNCIDRRTYIYLEKRWKKVKAGQTMARKREFRVCKTRILIGYTSYLEHAKYQEDDFSSVFWDFQPYFGITFMIWFVHFVEIVIWNKYGKYQVNRMHSSIWSENIYVENKMEATHTGFKLENLFYFILFSIQRLLFPLSPLETPTPLARATSLSFHLSTSGCVRSMHGITVTCYSKFIFHHTCLSVHKVRPILTCIEHRTKKY